MKMKTPKKKPVKTAKIPPPPPGWEIVGKDDPRWDNLPETPIFWYTEGRKWEESGYDAGEYLPETLRNTGRYALPIATQSATPQPQSPTPMIRLRLPSEKPTREDNVFAVCKTPNNKTLILSWPIILPFSGMVTHWFSLPEGILPREPSQEEKWEAEAALAYSQLPEATRPNRPGFIDGFLAAKKGGAE